MRSKQVLYILTIIAFGFTIEGSAQIDDKHKRHIESDSSDYLFANYYKNIETRRESDGRLDSLLVFDPIRFGKNIIDVFGIDFFLHSNPELIFELEQYLSVNLDEEEMTFQYWSVGIPTIMNKLNEANTFVPTENVWDGFITYKDNYNSNWGWRWPTEEPERYAFFDDLSSTLDSFTTFKTRTTANVGATKEIIYSFENPQERATLHFILLVNLFLNGSRDQLLDESLEFIDSLIYQPGLHETDNINQKLDSIRIVKNYLSFQTIINNNLYFKKSIINTTLLSNEQKVFWIIATIKLLCSLPDIDINAIMEALGRIHALYEYDESMDESELNFEMLEVQLYLLLFEKTGKIRYNDFATEILQKNREAVVNRSDLIYLQFNMGLVQNSINYWLYRKSRIQDYGKIYQLQILLFLFQVDRTLSNPQIIIDEEIFWRSLYYEKLAEYFMLKENFYEAERCFYKLLKLIKESPAGIFDTIYLETIIGHIQLLLLRQGKKENSQDWNNLNSSEQIVELQKFRQYPESIDELPKELRDAIAIEILNMNSDGIQNIIVTLGEVQIEAIINQLISFYINKGDYKNAYQLMEKKYFVWGRFLNRNIIDDKEIISKAYSKTIKTKLGRELSNIQTDIYDLLSDKFHLSEDIQNQINELNKLKFSAFISKNEINDLELIKFQLADLIEIKRRENEEVSKQKRYWQDTSVVLSILNDSIANTNFVLDSARAEIEFKKNEIEQSYFNVQIALVVAGLLTLLVVFFWRRSEKQKKEVARQSMISESLRRSISQLAHLSKDAIGEVAFSQLNTESLSQDPYNQLMKLQAFMARIHDDNLERIIEQTIEEERRICYLSIQANHYEQYGHKSMNEIIEVDDNIKELLVPVYTILNIVYNSFKYSKIKSGIKIKINSIYENQESVRMRVQDISEKSSTKKKENGSGEIYIQDMVRFFNGSKIDPQFKADFNELGYYVEFTILKK